MRRWIAIFLCGSFFNLITPSTLYPEISNAPAVPFSFNKLTHVIINRERGTLTFIGKSDPEGPKDEIPYLKLLSTALRLPEEKGERGVQGSEPGFSLNPLWETETGPSFENICRNAGSSTAAINRYLIQPYDGSDPEREEYLFLQTKREFFDFNRRRMSRTGRITAAQIENELSGVHHFPDYAKMNRSLVERGVYDPQRDFQGTGEELQEIMDSKFYSRGQVFVFAPSAMQKIFGKQLWLKLDFFGIPQDTQFARVIAEADYVMKSVVGTQGYPLKTRLPYHLIAMEWHAQNIASTELMQRYYLSLWLELQKLDITASLDGKMLAFSEPVVAVRSGGMTTGGKTPVSLEGYANFLTQHFSDYAKVCPQLWKLREAMKIVSLARYLKKEGIKVELEADHSWQPPQRLPVGIDLVSLGIGTRSQIMGIMGINGGVDLKQKSQVNIQSEPALPMEVTQGELLPDKTAEVQIGGEHYQAYTMPLGSEAGAQGQESVVTTTASSQPPSPAVASYGAEEPVNAVRVNTEEGGRLSPFPIATHPDRDKIVSGSKYDREVAPGETSISLQEAKNIWKYGTCQDLDGDGSVQPSWECVKPKLFSFQPTPRQTTFLGLVQERKDIEKQKVQLKKEREKIEKEISREYEEKQREVNEKAKAVVAEETQWKAQCGPGQRMTEAGYCESWSKKIEASRQYHVDWVKTEEEKIERKKVRVVGEAEVRAQQLEQLEENYQQKLDAYKKGQETPKIAAAASTLESQQPKEKQALTVGLSAEPSQAVPSQLQAGPTSLVAGTAESHYKKGLEWYEKKEYEKAIEEFSEAIRLKPNYAEAYSRRGYAWIGKFNAVKAISDFNEAIRLKPDFAESYCMRAQTWYALEGDYSKAAADANEALRLKPDFAEACNILGHLAFRAGDNDKAIDYYSKAVQYQGYYLKDVHALGYWNRSFCWEFKGDKEKAEADRKQYFSLATDQEEVCVTYASYLLSKRDFDKAITYASEAIRLNPRSVGAYLNRSIAWYEKKQPDKALADLDEAIRLNPECMEAYGNRGILFISQKQYDKALADLDEAARLNEVVHLKLSYLPYFNRGLVWWRKDELDKSMLDFKKAIELAPNVMEPHCYLGRILIVQGKPQEGVAEIEVSIKLVKSPSDYQMVSLAVGQWISGERQTALETLRPVYNREAGLHNVGDNWMPEWKQPELNALREMARELEKTSGPGREKKSGTSSKKYGLTDKGKGLVDSAGDFLKDVFSVFDE